MYINEQVQCAKLSMYLFDRLTAAHYTYHYTLAIITCI